jgi:metallophosphoesterase superfamily enzyme
MHDLALHSLVIAGDLFEKGPDSEIVEQLLSWLDRQGIADVRLVAGNHDRGLTGLPARMEVARGAVRLGAWSVLHGDEVTHEGRLAQGHLHPALRISRGTPLLPCFLAENDHLILPAYSAEAKGVDVSQNAKWHGYRRFVIVGSKVISLPPPTGQAVRGR